MDETGTFSCSDCGLLNCYRRDKRFPDQCLTTQADPMALAEASDAYALDQTDRRIAQVAAEIEGRYYGKLSRVEETVAFARRIGARRIGIATCLGLIAETRILAEVLRRGGFEPFAAVCKVGSVDKTEIGVPEELKLSPGSFEAACNPVLQARLMNDRGTDLNVLVGLCVGHDSLFIRHSAAPVTVLIVKDRLLGHNPAAALYTSGSYSKRILDEEWLKGL